MTDMRLYTIIDGQYVEVELGCIVVESGDYGCSYTSVDIDIDRADDGSTLTTIEREV